MRKTILLMILIASVFILSACEGIDLSQLSDEDLARIADQAIVCNAPYMRFGLGCCLDEDNDSICDEGQGALGVDLAALYEQYPGLQGVVEQAWSPEFEELEDLGDVEFLEETKNKSQNQKAETMLAVAQKEIEKAARKIEEAYNKNKSTGVALEAKLEAEEIFAQALDAYNLGNFNESIDLAKESRKLANKAGGKFIDKTEDDLDEDDDEEFEDEDQEDAFEAIEDAQEEIEKAEEKIEDKTADKNVTLARSMLDEALVYLQTAQTFYDNGNYAEVEEPAETAEELAADARMKYLGKSSDHDDDEDDEDEEEAECSIDSDCDEGKFCDEGECEDLEDDEDEAECSVDSECDEGKFCDEGECEDLEDEEDDDDSEEDDSDDEEDDEEPEE